MVNVSKIQYRYIVSGPVRGCVSRHRSLKAAVRSLDRDRRYCKRLGGYSDCYIYDTMLKKPVDVLIGRDGRFWVLDDDDYAR